MFFIYLLNLPLLEEVAHAIKIPKSGKASVSDEISTEIVKLFGENGIQTLTKLFNDIYHTATMSTNW